MTEHYITDVNNIIPNLGFHCWYLKSSPDDVQITFYPKKHPINIALVGKPFTFIWPKLQRTDIQNERIYLDFDEEPILEYDRKYKKKMLCNIYYDIHMFCDYFGDHKIVTSNSGWGLKFYTFQYKDIKYFTNNHKN